MLENTKARSVAGANQARPSLMRRLFAQAYGEITSAPYGNLKGVVDHKFFVKGRS